MNLTIAALMCVSLEISALAGVIKGKVIDEQNAPVPDCIISNHWVFYPDRPVCRTGRRDAVTDASGGFELQLQDKSASKCFLMLSLQQEKGRLLLDWVNNTDSLEVVLTDLVKIRGRIQTPLNKPIDPVDFGMMIGVRNKGVLGNIHVDSQGRFALLLPPGEYVFGGSGELFVSFAQPLVVKSGTKTMELEPIKLQPTAMGKLFGKQAPDWKITSAIPAEFDSQPSDLLGRWVLIDFCPAWSFLRGAEDIFVSSYNSRLRNLMEFEAEYQDRSDKFAIIVFYLADLKGFSDANNDAKRSIRDTWPSPRLPFVCALDRTLETANAWGIDRNHMSLLLAPDGRVHPCSTHMTLIELRRQLEIGDCP